MADKSDSVPLFVRLSDLADEVELHPHAVEKYLFRKIIFADASIKHGRTTQPIFLQSRVAEITKTIRKHREAMEKALA
jgi:hypothetical protein